MNLLLHNLNIEVKWYVNVLNFGYMDTLFQQTLVLKYEVWNKTNMYEMYHKKYPTFVAKH
jgi:hypothetical protein